MLESLENAQYVHMNVKLIEKLDKLEDVNQKIQ